MTHSEAAFSLWNLKPGTSAIIAEMAEKIPAPYRRRLRELGFHPQETITCVKKTLAGGPRLYQIGNCVYSLEREIADAIAVRNFS